MTLYTAGIWTVRPGHEDEFVALWKELADWSASAFGGARGALLRDREQRSRFLSFGSWESDEQVEAWRAAPEWQDIVGRLRAVLDDFQPGTYDVIVDRDS